MRKPRADIFRTLLGFVSALACATCAWGYSNITNDNNQPLSWPEGTIPMRIQVDDAATLSDGTHRSSTIQVAMQAWNAQIKYVQFTSQLALPGNGTDHDDINQIFFASTPYDYGWDNNTLAITTIWYSGAQMKENDIIFNVAYSWDSYRGPLRADAVDLRRVALHELGHVLGLDHPDDNGQSVAAIMNSTVSDLETLQPDDIAGAQFHYGAPPSAPAVTSQPANKTADIGQSVQFNVSVSGSPAPTCRWQRLPAGSATWANLSDGGAYSGTGTTSLGVSAVITAMNGDKFRCIATNASGSATSSVATLTVNPPIAPVISGLPATLTLNYGDPLNLNATVTGSPPIAFQWKKDGSVLAGATSSAYTQNYATIADGGSYTLTATNAGGTVTSANVSVTVNPAVAPVITGLPVTVTLNYGDDLSLSPSVTGTQPITFQWKKDGSALAGATGSAYVKHYVTPADIGTYTLVAANLAGTVASSNVSLAVNAAIAPVITMQPAGQMVDAGSPVSFTVAVSGSPAPTYQWMKDSVNIVGATGSTYSIASAIASNAGSYTVVATNPAGNATSSPAVLAVRYNPTVTNRPLSRVASVGQSATFAIAATGSNLTYLWRHNGHTIAGATSASLTIPQVSLLDRGRYEVAVSNPSGGTSWSVFMFVVRPTSSSVVGWGAWNQSQATIPAGVNNLMGVAAGSSHNVGVRFDGTVVAWGTNNLGQTNVPAGLSNVIAVGAGGVFSVALKTDGTVVAWGNNDLGEISVPAGLTNVVQISASIYGHTLALKSDGTVTAWGRNLEGQTTVPVGLKNVVSVAANIFFSLAVKADGTIVTWGYNGNNFPPDGTTDVVSAALGFSHGLLIKTNGTVSAWGYNGYGQTNVPAGLSNVVGVSAGSDNSLALRSDGIPFAWGDDSAGAADVPPGLSGVFELVSGYNYCLALIGEPWLPVIVGNPSSQTAASGSTVTFTATASGTPAPTFQWQKDGVNIAGATNSTYAISNVTTSTAGSYTLIATNAAGSATSTAASLTVTPAIVRASGDFNHDGHADALWHNTSTGLVCAWVSGGGFTVFGVEGDGWSVLGTGDFDGDGHTDALWHNTSTGLVASWTSSGGFTVFGVEGGGWSVLGIGDFDGDSRSDVVWHDTTTGLVASWTSSGGFTNLGAEGGGWEVIGTGDFNGDGKADLLWHNTYTNVVAAGLTNGSYVALDTEGGGWEIIGVGDFNGDGTTDLLWHNSYTGVVSGELIGGGYVSLGTEDGGWAVIGTGDFDGDGITDVLWHNTSTGLVASWTSGGGFTVFGVEGGGWSVIP